MGAKLEVEAAMAWLAFLGHFYLIAGLWLPSPIATMSTSTTLDIVWFNMMFNKSALIEFERHVKNIPADIIALAEIDRHTTPNLIGYPYSVRSNKYNILVLSKLPLDNPIWHHIAEGGRDQLNVVISIPNKTVNLGVVHLRHPNLKAHFIELEHLTSVTKSWENGIVVGDFNASVWASPFRRFAQDSSLHNCRQGVGVVNSWAWGANRWLPLAIDHILFKGSVEVQSFQLLEWTSSDHRPIRCKFRI